MCLVKTFGALLLALVVAPSLWAQFELAPAGKGSRLGESQTQRYQAGVIIRAQSGPCRGIVATIPVPENWPEQEVKVDVEEIDKSVRSVRYKSLNGAVKQMVVTVPFLPAGQTAKAVVTYEITRSSLLPPENPDIFTLPKKLSLTERRNLGQSPQIESRHTEIRAQTRSLLAEHETANAWQKVKILHDWIREHVKKQRGRFKGAVQTLRDGQGNEEDLTSLFIALCRASDVPARTVWIPDACYAEFLLADDEGKNHWLPCRLTGDDPFGSVKTNLSILQKGDNFKVPERREAVRFVPEFLKGAGGRPSVEFIRTPLGG